MSVVTAYGLLFGALCLWGCFPLLRRYNGAEGQLFTCLSFLGEFVLILTFALVDIQSSSELLNIEAEQRFRATLLLLGGCVTGIGNFLGLVALRHVPASIGSSVLVGSSTAFGTILTFFLFGNDQPKLLFTGLLLILLSMLLQSWALGRSPAVTNTDDTNVVGNKTSGVTADIGDTKPQATKDVVLTIKGSDMKQKTFWKCCRPPNTSGQWLVILLLVGTFNGSWVVFSSFGRVSFSNHHTYLIYIGGRCLIQPFCHLFVYLSGNGIHDFFPQLWQMGAADKVTAFFCGLSLCGGYGFYFEGSASINTSAAFAITSCCPLFTMTVGSLFLNDLKTLDKSSKIIFCGSVLIFVLAVMVLTLSGL
jgi:drug/metabolite transporter (DMT)-like permease